MDRESKSSKADVKTSASRSPRKRAPTGVRSVELRLADALAQQAATAEILRVMADSSNDVQPVLHAIAEQAARLCRAAFARVFLVDGDMMRPLAQFTEAAELETPVHAMRLSRGSISGRATLDRKTVHVADVVPLLDHEFPDARENAQTAGIRASLAVPLLRHEACHGAIFLWRREPGLFAPDQVALVETFARQAAIAIDNARLFNEVQARNKDLTEALEQQTATSEILRVISGSPTDVQPVFDTIAANALRLCDGVFSGLYRFDGDFIHIGAMSNIDTAGVAAFRTAYPCRPNRGGATQRAILTGQLVHIPDIRDDPEYTYQGVAEATHYRSVLSVPMLRDGKPLGTITVYRDVPRPFPNAQIDLLKTFAEQAVIAIENVRLLPSSVHATAISPKPSSSKPRATTCCASSDAPRPRCSRCSTRSRAQR